jgi:hypothetical protein
MFTTQEKITELKQELARRAREYPGQIIRGEIKLVDAERRSSIILAVIVDYERERHDQVPMAERASV